MKAIVCDGYGGPEVLKVGERPMPVLASDEVLIKVDYAGVNRAETLQR
jgi:NADPH2:quinone reductase